MERLGIIKKTEDAREKKYEQSLGWAQHQECTVECGKGLGMMPPRRENNLLEVIGVSLTFLEVNSWHVLLSFSWRTWVRQWEGDMKDSDSNLDCKTCYTGEME